MQWSHLLYISYQKQLKSGHGRRSYTKKIYGVVLQMEEGRKTFCTVRSRNFRGLLTLSVKHLTENYANEGKNWQRSYFVAPRNLFLPLTPY